MDRNHFTRHFIMFFIQNSSYIFLIIIIFYNLLKFRKLTSSTII